jgi:hypothetical protein
MKQKKKKIQKVNLPLLPRSHFTPIFLHQPTTHIQNIQSYLKKNVQI